MSSLKIQAHVWVQVAKSSPERHYIPNWNFMLIRRTILIVTCQPGISLLCSSSSYKISMRRTWYSKLEIYAKDKKNDDKLVFLVGTVWCLGLLQETVWLIWNYFEFLIQSLIMIYCTRMETNWSQINHSTNKKKSSFILGSLNPLSPSSEKKRRQRLKMSLEAKEAQREKSKFEIQRRRWKSYKEDWLPRTHRHIEGDVCPC